MLIRVIMVNGCIYHLCSNIHYWLMIMRVNLYFCMVTNYVMDYVPLFFFSPFHLPLPLHFLLKLLIFSLHSFLFLLPIPSLSHSFYIIFKKLIETFSIFFTYSFYLFCPWRIKPFSTSIFLIFPSPSHLFQIWIYLRFLKNFIFYFIMY